MKREHRTFVARGREEFAGRMRMSGKGARFSESHCPHRRAAQFRSRRCRRCNRARSHYDDGDIRVAIAVIVKRARLRTNYEKGKRDESHNKQRSAHRLD